MYLFPEHVMVLAAARALERPVRWSGGRAEGFQSDNHARDQINVGELALGPDGEILALRVNSRSEEHTSELQSLMRISYAVFCLKKKNKQTTQILTQLS